MMLGKARIHGRRTLQVYGGCANMIFGLLRVVNETGAAIN
jgi:hypothetical protein